MQNASRSKTEREAGAIDVVFFVFLGLLAVCCIFLLATIVRHLAARQTGYTLTASTELVSVALHDPRGARIRLPEARIRSQQDAPEQVVGRSSLRLADGVTATLQRLQKNELKIRLDWPDGPGERAWLVRDGREVSLGDHQTLAVPADQGTVTFVFRGRVTLGQTAPKEFEGVLLKAHVAVYQKPWFGDARLLVSDAALDLGDYPVWVARATRDKQDPCVRMPADPREGEPENVCVEGFVHVSDDEALQVVVHADAEHVTVLRNGGADYRIAPTWWDEFAHDPYVSASAAVAGFVTSLLILYELLPNVWERVVQIHRQARDRHGKRP